MPNYQRDILVKLSRLISLQWAKIFPLLLFVDTFLASSLFMGSDTLLLFLPRAMSQKSRGKVRWTLFLCECVLEAAFRSFPFKGSNVNKSALVLHTTEPLPSNFNLRRSLTCPGKGK